MNWSGWSPATLAIGAAVAAALVFALHLLRVRLRRVEVDTLLFLRLAGTVRQPRALPGRPSRWLALLLALLAVGAAWTALGDPRDHGGRSRLLVVEPAPPDASGELAAARLAQVRAVAERGLGPRGRVLAATSPPTVLWVAGEPWELLVARFRALPAAPSAAGGRDALALPATSGEERIWIGSSPAPWGTAGQVAASTVPGGDGPVLRALRWERRDAGTHELVVQHAFPLAAQAELLVAGQVVASAELPAGSGSARLAPFTGATAPRLRVTSAAGVHAIDLPLPASARLRVALVPGLPAAVARAVDALLAVDAELERVTEAEAEVVVAADDDGDARPRLVVTPGIGDAARRPDLAADAPVALSLRDRQRRSATALPAMADALPWVVDVRTGAALVAATVTPRLRVFAVDWLLQPESHADVPLLLAEALRQLGNWPRTAIATLQQPFTLPFGLPGTVAVDEVALQPRAGALRHAFARVGAHAIVTPAGTRAVEVVDACGAGAVPGNGPTLPLADLPGGRAWAPWLLLLLCATLVADAFLFHRGRLP